MGQPAQFRIPTVIDSGGFDTRRRAPWCPIEVETFAPTGTHRSATAARRRVGDAVIGTSQRRTQPVYERETDDTY